MDYITAQCVLNNQFSREGIIEIDGVEAGYVRTLEAAICGQLIHAVILDRGPVWFDGFGTREHNYAFFEQFAAKFPKRFGRMRRIIPEIEDTPENHEMMTALGYKRKQGAGYQTIMMDLRHDDDTLRKSLKKSWRTALNKAERQGEELVVEWDNKTAFLPWFLQNYALDKALKGYQGPSQKLLLAFARTFGVHRKMLIGKALYKDKPVAGILLLCHGKGATYQVGWNHEEGRDVCAHNLLLWDALRVLKEKGVTVFDLGGLNDESAAGVGEFKKSFAGKKGRAVQLAGFYT